MKASFNAAAVEAPAICISCYRHQLLLHLLMLKYLLLQSLLLLLLLHQLLLRLLLLHYAAAAIYPIREDHRLAVQQHQPQGGPGRPPSGEKYNGGPSRSQQTLGGSSDPLFCDLLVLFFVPAVRTPEKLAFLSRQRDNASCLEKVKYLQEATKNGKIYLNIFY